MKTNVMNYKNLVAMFLVGMAGGSVLAMESALVEQAKNSSRAHYPCATGHCAVEKNQATLHLDCTEGTHSFHLPCLLVHAANSPVGNIKCPTCACEAKVFNTWALSYMQTLAGLDRPLTQKEKDQLETLLEYTGIRPSNREFKTAAQARVNTSVASENVAPNVTPSPLSTHKEDKSTDHSALPYFSDCESDCNIDCSAGNNNNSDNEIDPMVLAFLTQTVTEPLDPAILAQLSEEELRHNGVSHPELVERIPQDLIDQMTDEEKRANGLPVLLKKNKEMLYESF